MTPEALIEAFARGVIRAILEVAAEDPKPASRRRRHLKSAPTIPTPGEPFQEELIPQFRSPADNENPVPPLTAEDYARIEAMFKSDDPPGTYRPDDENREGGPQWLGAT